MQRMFYGNKTVLEQHLAPLKSIIATTAENVEIANLETSGLHYPWIEKIVSSHQAPILFEIRSGFYFKVSQKTYLK